MPRAASSRALGHGADVGVVVRPVHNLAEALLAGDLLKSAYELQGEGSPAYREHLRDVGPRMTLAELLVAVDGDNQLLGSVTYCLAGTSYALVSREGEGELRMLGCSEHRAKARTEELLIEACIARAERDHCSALVMSSPRTRGRKPGRTFERLGFRNATGRELAPMPGIVLDVFTLPLPREPSTSGSSWRWR